MKLSRMRAWPWTGTGLIALGGGAAANALLGPLVLKVIDYRTSQDMLNQFKGADLATLAVVAPAAMGAGLLWLSRHPLAPIASLAPAAYAVYTFTQAILGQDYGRYEGNGEKFFPLQLGLVVLGGALALRSWSAIDGSSLPTPSKRLRRTAAAVFLGSAAFLTFGLHVPGLLAAWRGDPPAEYLDTPAAFWIVKLMDLGIVAPVAIAAGIGLLAGSRTALKAAYGVSGALAMLGASVTAMGAVMQLNDDPSASSAFTIGFGVITGAFAALALRLASSALVPSVSGETRGHETEEGRLDA